MYEVITTQSKELLSASNVAELRTILEEAFPRVERPARYPDWSPSRCVIYYIQEGHVTPYSGPEWFMALAPNPNLVESPSEKPTYSQGSMDFVLSTGKLRDGTCQIHVWQDRNHARLVFQDDDQHVFHEVIITEWSLRNLWLAIGRAIGFHGEGLKWVIEDLPPTRLHTLPPERTQPYNAEEFDILGLIDRLEAGEIPDGFWDDDSAKDDF